MVHTMRLWRGVFILAACLLFLLPLQCFAQGAPGLLCEGQTYTGRKISINLSNADVHDVLRILAEAGGVNIIVGDDVKGRVTLKLTNIPWDQALDLVLQTLGLARVTIDP